VLFKEKLGCAASEINQANAVKVPSINPPKRLLSTSSDLRPTVIASRSDDVLRVELYLKPDTYRRLKVAVAPNIPAITSDTVVPRRFPNDFDYLGFRHSGLDTCEIFFGECLLISSHSAIGIKVNKVSEDVLVAARIIPAFSTLVHALTLRLT
jgi:hypothetical protein